MIKAVLFDVDGVLIDSFETNVKFFQDLFQKAGYNPPTKEEYKFLFHRTFVDVIKIITKTESEDEIKRIYDMRVNKEIVYPVDLLNFPPKIKETVSTLSQKYALGIVTSRIKESVFESETMKELQPYFDCVVTFSDTVNHKPHPEPLLLCAEKMGVNPSECVYIGDSETDIVAAKSAGMKVILFPDSGIFGADIATNIFDLLPSIISEL